MHTRQTCLSCEEKLAAIINWVRRAAAAKKLGFGSAVVRRSSSSSLSFVLYQSMFDEDESGEKLGAPQCTPALFRASKNMPQRLIVVFFAARFLLSALRRRRQQQRESSCFSPPSFIYRHFVFRSSQKRRARSNWSLVIAIFLRAATSWAGCFFSLRNPDPWVMSNIIVHVNPQFFLSPAIVAEELPARLGGRLT